MTDNLDANSTSDASKTEQSGFRLWHLQLVVAIACVSLAFFLMPVRSAREAARRSQCKNNLKQIGLALHNYYDQYGGFPPAYTVDAEGKPLHSWRTLILPFIDQPALYNRIDLSKPWNHPVNLEAGKAIVPAYHCPSAKLPPEQTLYLAVVGDHFALHPTQSRQWSEVSNGISNVIMVAEVSAANAVPWMSPLDADEKLVLSFAPKSGLPHENGMHALFMDGAVQLLDANMPAIERHARMRISGKGD